MTPSARADIVRLVTSVVARRLMLDVDDLTPTTDLRTFRAFSSFVAVDILEESEARLGAEVPPELLAAELLCSVNGLAELFDRTFDEQTVVAR